MIVFAHKLSGQHRKTPTPCWKYACDYSWGKGATHIIVWLKVGHTSYTVERKDIDLKGKFKLQSGGIGMLEGWDPNYVR